MLSSVIQHYATMFLMDILSIFNLKFSSVLLMVRWPRYVCFSTDIFTSFEILCGVGVDYFPTPPHKLTTNTQMVISLTASLSIVSAAVFPLRKVSHTLAIVYISHFCLEKKNKVARQAQLEKKKN